MTEEQNIHKDHRLRVKKQFLETAEKGMNDYSLLEFLLFFSVPQGDTNPLAHRLIEAFGSIDKVFEATPRELLEVKGVGEHTAVFLSSFLPVFRRYSERKATDSFLHTEKNKVESFLRSKYTGVANEQALILCFNAEGKFSGYSFLGDGSLGEVTFDKRKITAAVLKDKAAAVVLVHNHPSGIVNPSTDDIEAVKVIADFLKNIDVTVVDNIIITTNDILFFSDSRKLSEALD